MAVQSVVLLSNLRKDLLEVFPDHVTWPQHPDLCHTAEQAAVVSLVNDLVRKELPHKDDSALIDKLERNAQDKFLWANSLCESYDPKLRLTEAVLDEVRVILSKLPEVSWHQIFSRARTGPGASVGSQGRNSTLEKLFLNEITSYSPDTVKRYIGIVRLFPLYRAAELQRLDSCGPTKAFRIVGSSNFSTVRKTTSTDRGICTESSLDMFFQLGVGEVINEFLSDEFGYDSALQPDRNRRLVIKGSMTGRTATVDLTSASDLNSVGFVSDALHFRMDWVELLNQLRAPAVKLLDGTVVAAHMISSMGNGFTFPLETLLFSSIIKALCKVLDVPFKRFDLEQDFGVFGDDLIVPVSIVEPLLAVLADLGHIPNPKKTFTRGPFRESCGVDAFEGQDVRAVFHKSWTRAGRYATINGLNRWSAKWGIPLTRTIRYLLPKGWKDHFVPLFEDPSSGIHAPFELGSGYLAWANKPVYDFIYNVKKVKGSRERIYTLKRRFGNPFGVLGCIVDGSIREGRIGRRSTEEERFDESTRSEVMRTTTHWVCEQELRIYGISREMWTTLAGLNLSV